MEDNKKPVQTERQKRDKRRAYMKKYYQKRKYQLGNGKSTRCVKKLKKSCGRGNTLTKEFGSYTVRFD